MISFYGGPQGQSFEISKIFSNYKELKKDEAEQRFSPVQLNEFVWIDYGDRFTVINTETNMTEYETNKGIDSEDSGKIYHATLWQKIYNTDSKYVYQPLGSLMGDIPIFKTVETTPTNDNKATVNIDNSEIDYPKLTFNLPRARKFWFGEPEDISLVGDDDYLVDMETGEVKYRDGEEWIASGFYFKPSEITLDYLDDTYDDNGKLLSGIANLSTANGTWGINLQLPPLPNINLTAKLAEKYIDDPGELISSPSLSKNTVNYILTIPRGKTGEQGDTGPGLEILQAKGYIKTNDTISNMDYIRNILNTSSENIETYQVLPIVLKTTPNYDTYSYWCTYNEGWSILPLTGGSAEIAWEEIN